MPNEKRSVEYTPEFKRNLRLLARRYRHIRSDLSPMIEALHRGETPGIQVPDTTYTVFKVRAKNTDARKGKSGGYRIIYFLPMPQKAILVTVYSKSDQSDISAARIRQIISESEA